MDITSSEDNSNMTFTCHLACQTDFITGCNIKIINTCGNEFIESCTVDNTQTFSPRQCSVVFEDLPASSYAYIAEVRSENLLQPGANKLNMTGFFVITGKFLVSIPLYSQDSNYYTYYININNTKRRAMKLPLYYLQMVVIIFLVKVHLMKVITVLS